MENGKPILTEKSREFLIEQAAGRRAAATPLPGPLADAFGSNCIMVGTVAVRKIVNSDWSFFHKINSPLLEITKEKATGGELDLKVTELQEAEIVWQFTHTPKQCRDLFEKGKDVWENTVRAEVDDAIDQPLIRLIIMAVMEHIGQSWKTTLEYKAKLEEDGKLSFFRESKTASDGGSTTVAAS